ncbi:MAG: type II secretion system F family protein [Desulfotignum sp.]|nr:type II secretion system F family protein [Desulfotignum sp.]
MDFMIISAIIFIISLFIIELSLYAFRNLRATQRARLKKRLRKYTFTETDAGDIIKNRRLSDIDTLNRILNASATIRALDRLLIQANVKYSLSVYILSAFFLAAFSGMITQILTSKGLVAGGVGFIAFFLPYLYLVHLKNRRAKKFQSQLHEALDLIARALRAGHSFTSALQVASDEFDDPLGTEFEETIDEINFGVSVPNALKNLLTRVDCKELRFFVMSVLIQRETGGNLSALIESLAHIVRERFRFEGNVRTLSAEGRLSAVILIMIPFLVGLFLFATSPGFIRPLIDEPIGRILIGAAAVGIIFGSLVMKKMVAIEV